MRILVIGGTNFIGPYVVRHLHASRHHVAIFNRGRHKADLPESIEHVYGDRKNLSDFQAQFKSLAPDVVLDMIPFTAYDAENLMNTFRGIAPRIVAISSVDVYRAYGILIGKETLPADAVPLTENAPLRQNLYPFRAETPKGNDDPNRWMDEYDKILVERVVMSDPGLPGTILRLPMVYGPGDGRRIFSCLKRMDDKRPAILMSMEQAQWCWTRGYVGNVLPEHLKDTLNRTQHLITDTRRIRQDLGYRDVVSLDEGIKQTIAWERANPPKKVDIQQFDYDAENTVLATETNIA